jgi:hypothetical protein
MVVINIASLKEHRYKGETISSNILKVIAFVIMKKIKKVNKM